MNFNYSASEGAFASSVKQSGVDWFITADTFMRKLQNFPWPPQRDLILMERESPCLKVPAKRWGLAIKFLTAGFMIKKLGLDAPTGADEAVLMFTSGSSGEPKGVPLTHHNLLSNISQCSSRITLEPQNRFLGSLPVFHCFGITIGLWYIDDRRVRHGHLPLLLRPNGWGPLSSSTESVWQSPAHLPARFHETLRTGHL